MHEDLFTAADRRQMAALGISVEEAERQIELFRNPPPFTHVLRPCSVGDGIRQLLPGEHAEPLAVFEREAAGGGLGKLVPASGAATRMFHPLLASLQGDGVEMTPEVRSFFANLPRFAFYHDLAAAVAGRGGKMSDHRAVLEALLFEPGLGYAEQPKGLLKFHREGGEARTAFEEHLVEAAAVTRDAAGVCRLHVTVSLHHESGFAELLEEVRPRYEERLGCRFEVTFSHQARSTDTLAVDPGNRPFRQDDGTLLFRPGGHGALIANLQTLAGLGWDVALLKNIDNVVPDSRKAAGVLWKKLLTGVLLRLRERISGMLDRLEAGPASSELLEEAESFLAGELLVQARAGTGAEERRRALIDRLDRPLRVCGVVRNLGEPGGGPFWVEAPDGGVSLQIVETSQIHPESPEQRAALAASSHFNPTDLACLLRDRRGRPYDLARFIDPSAVFISQKSHEGRPLKALERPGLWNGAMARWNTVFVEIPDETFAPVKTVLDLLRPEHQG
jgi:Domain of unknown function (DUF4301)